MPLNKSQRVELQDWVELHRCCAICWWPESDGRRPLQVHHLIQGQHRHKAHHPKCYLRLCDRCHDVLHDGRIAGNFPNLTKGMMLTAKQESDPDNYDVAHLAKISCRVGLAYDPEPIPEFYLEERNNNVGSWSRRKP